MNTTLSARFFTWLAASIAAAFALALSAATPVQAQTVKNIVLVHGAFVGGAGWRPVYDILVRDGFKVTLVQQPLTGLADDVAATKRVLALQDGATILVGHSYGGAIITEAGTDPHVVGLVYIAAHAPDQGETESANGKKFPPAAKPPLKTPDGYVYLDPVRYPSDFAADLPAPQAHFEANAQMLTAAEVFTTPIVNPAWKAKPSWYLVATADRIINPELERMYALRANSHRVEVQGASHAVYESRPKEVAALIEAAARHALDKP
jgi:pimeloyl-ACP methyl ester carboxylesterase